MLVITFRRDGWAYVEGPIIYFVDLGYVNARRLIGYDQGKSKDGPLGYSIDSIACVPGFCLSADTNSIRIIH